MDDETLAYFPEFVRYLRHREIQWVHSQRKIVGDRTDIPSNRALLMSWLLEVALHFHISQVSCSSFNNKGWGPRPECKTSMNERQETLYHAVGMIDGTLAMRDVDNAHLQLVAITSLLIAAKLEEYHPPSIKVRTVSGSGWSLQYAQTEQ